MFEVYVHRHQSKWQVSSVWADKRYLHCVDSAYSSHCQLHYITDVQVCAQLRPLFGAAQNNVGTTKAVLGVTRK